MYDLVLTDGLVVDGSRAKPYTANVCVKDGKIARITGEAVTDAAKVLDVSGRVVAPGFIDLHTHSDGSALVDYVCDSKIAQGVTTEIAGNCGTSCMPSSPEYLELNHEQNSVGQLPLYGVKIGRMSVTDYAEDVNKVKPLTNFGSFVGHGTLRLAVMGFVNRDPNEEEMEQLKALLDRELERGAFGMSLGLIYPPSAFSKKEELIELAKVLKKHDALLCVHMRNEGPKVFEATDEMLEIAEKSGVHLQISHIKLMGKPQWGRSGELIQKVEDARARGINVTCDQYPFTASATSLSTVLPNWAHEGGVSAQMERLSAPTQELKEGMAAKIAERGGAHTILITTIKNGPRDNEGKYLSEVAAKMGVDPVDAAIQIMLSARMAVKCVFFCMNEADVLNFMPKMYICVGSDGVAFSYDPKWTPMNPHPRNFGTFPQFFQMVRQHNLMPIEDAVYKATGLPAQFLHLKDRGILKEGYAADITVFDPAAIENRSTYTEAKVKPAGIDYVIVNGKVAMDHNELTGDRGGKALLFKK